MSVRGAAAKDLAREQQMFQNYLRDLKKDHQMKKGEVTQEQKTELTAMNELHTDRRSKQEHAYKVELTRRKESYEDELHSMTNSYEKQIKELKMQYDREYEATVEREEARIDDYRTKQEHNLANIRERYMRVQEEMESNYEES